MIWLLKILPRKALSRFMGFLMHFQGPAWFRGFTIRGFAWLYKINIEEAEKSIDEYRSIGHFFSRKLRAGLRPISSSWAVHPCDSQILQHGVIRDGVLIQAKGYNYRLVELTEDPEALQKFGDGYFITYYLCPTDYHRVHSPALGYIKSVTYRNGDLWPVNLASVGSVKNLYIHNERLIVDMATDHGPVAVVMVGATNVGSMSLSFDPKIRTNQHYQSKRHTYTPAVEIEKGEELGIFHMGSTVILLFSKEFYCKFKDQLSLTKRVRVGESLTMDASSSSAVDHFINNPIPSSVKGPNDF